MKGETGRSQQRKRADEPPPVYLGTVRSREIHLIYPHLPTPCITRSRSRQPARSIRLSEVAVAQKRVGMRAW